MSEYNRPQWSLGNKKDNPCYGCTEETGRSEVCHATCERYNVFFKKRCEYNANKLKDKECYITNSRRQKRKVK